MVTLCGFLKYVLILRPLCSTKNEATMSPVWSFVCCYMPLVYFNINYLTFLFTAQITVILSPCY